MGVWRKVRLKKGLAGIFCVLWNFAPEFIFKVELPKLEAWAAVLLKLTNQAAWGRVSKWHVSFYSLLSKKSVGFLVVTIKVGFGDMYLSLPKSLPQSVPTSKSCVSVFTLASAVQSNIFLIKAHQLFGSFASLCFPLELWNKRWWEIAEICQNTLFFCKMIQIDLFKCSWKLPGRYSQMLIETSCAPKVVFRKKGRLQSVKNVVRKLPEL